MTKIMNFKGLKYFKYKSLKISNFDEFQGGSPLTEGIVSKYCIKICS